MPFDWKYEHPDPIFDRPPLKWPKNARVAMIFSLAIETWGVPDEYNPRLYDQPKPSFTLLQPQGAPPGKVSFPNVTFKEYGYRVGIWRLQRLLDKYGIKASVPLDCYVLERYPEVIKRLYKHGWEVYHHNWDHSKSQHSMTLEEERAVIKKCVDAMQKVLGIPPTGWLGSGAQCSENTLRLLAENGFTWHTDFQNDDQPYLIQVAGKTLVEIPYQLDINDYYLWMLRHMGPSEVFEVYKNHFDTLYEEGKESGRVMTVNFHPHITGAAHRAPVLEKFIKYAKDHSDVWLGATRAEIVKWYMEKYVGAKKQ